MDFQVLKSGFQVVFRRPGLNPNVPEKVGEKVTENQRAILDSMTANTTITARELSQIVGISERKIKENISKLKKRGLLRRIGPDKGGRWETTG